jgi:hypothetical protein
MHYFMYVCRTVHLVDGNICSALSSVLSLTRSDVLSDVPSLLGRDGSGMAILCSHSCARVRARIVVLEENVRTTSE